MLFITPAWQRSNRHKMVVVSDLHFPRPDSHPKYFYEFLLNNPSDTLVILGDFFEGYDKSLGEFGEWHKRCLDLMHQRQNEEELKVIVIPGNHDQYLRDERVLNHHLFGSLYRRHMVLQSGSQKTYMTHGDDYDQKTVRDNDIFAYQAGAGIRVARVSLSELYNHYVGSSDKRLSASFAKRSHAALEKKIRKGILASATEHECNAVLCGHTHEPQPFMPVKKHTWLRYGNTGSFTGKLATAMVLSHDDRWKMVNWKEVRAQKGFDALPHRDDDNPALRYRDMTEAEINFHQSLHSVWMSRRMLGQAQIAVQKIREMAARIEDMLNPQEEALDRAFAAAAPERARDHVPLHEPRKQYEPVPVLVA